MRELQVEWSELVVQVDREVDVLVGPEGGLRVVILVCIFEVDGRVLPSDLRGLHDSNPLKEVELSDVASLPEFEFGFVVRVPAVDGALGV